jgi:hypothetical protein
MSHLQGIGDLPVENMTDLQVEEELKALQKEINSLSSEMKSAFEFQAGRAIERLYLYPDEKKLFETDKRYKLKFGRKYLEIVKGIYKQSTCKPVVDKIPSMRNDKEEVLKLSIEKQFELLSDVEQYWYNMEILGIEMSTGKITDDIKREILETVYKRRINKK